MEPRDPFDLCGVTIDGKYRVASVVGDGGFGVVYRGVHKGFGELIAIKCLKLPTSLDEEARAELLEKLQDEGRILHRLSKATSGIVQALDVGAFTSPSGVWVPYLVMEWLEGETLAEHLKRRDAAGEAGMDLADAIRLLEPAARALATAHGQKIAHRDVKPANIFLSEVGGRKTAKVLDFGIAKVLSDHRGYTTALEATAMAPTAFTPRYGAPEQFNKQRGATGPWTDVFALALVMVECVSGRKALQGDDPTQLYIASADPALRPTLRARGVQVDEEVEDVLRKALEVEPKNRYPDAGAFWSALTTAASVAGSDTYPQLPGATLAVRPSGPRSSRPSSSPRLDRGAASDNEPLLDTSEFAARRSSASSLPDSADAKSAFGPTIPHESLKAERKDRDKNGKSARSRISDAMEETPEGARLKTMASAKATASGDLDATSAGSSKGSYIWATLAVAVFAGGAYFVYATLSSPTTPKKPNASSASASASSSGRAKPQPTASSVASVRTTASATASATVGPTASVVATVSATVGPTASVIASTSASAAPKGGEHDDMLRIDGATVTVGDPGKEVPVSGFWIDRLEVNVRRYSACINAKACSPADNVVDSDAGDATSWANRCNAKSRNSDHPINCVTFAQAEAFCAWEGKRLPTEAEWQLAAGGPKSRKHPWGDAEPTCEQSCFDRNAGCRDPSREVGTCEVGGTPVDATPGLVYDMAGNVSEWVAATDAGAERVTKGGNFFLGAEALLATFRSARPATFAHPTVGFRCAASK